VCKFFLNALEHSRYGWKWMCPNGMNCIYRLILNKYRHCLPPNYLFKKKGEIKKDEDSDENETLEQVIDNKI
jgi:hypothetical protein